MVELRKKRYMRHQRGHLTFREKLVIWTLLDTGLRVSEFCGLNLRDLQWQEKRIVVCGKGGRFGLRKKRRIVPLTLRVRRLFEAWFTINEKIGMSPRTVQRLVKKVANQARITKPVTPHVVRHSFATKCVKKWMSTASLKKILGHDRLETTEIYLNICPEDTLGEFFQKVEDGG